MIVSLEMVCNKCGERIKKHEQRLSLYYAFGYKSSHDGKRAEIDLCDKCLCAILMDIIPQCKISPVTDPDEEYASQAKDIYCN